MSRPVPWSSTPSRSRRERWVGGALGACAAVSVATTAVMVGLLVWEAVPFFRDVGLVRFFADREWTPQFSEQAFGVWPLVSGTVLVTAIAGAVALPLGLLCAVYLAEYAPERGRRLLKPSLELLAGVPTVVFGYFALTFVTPMLQGVVPGLGVYNALSAGLAVGVMVMPIVASLGEDALRAVPRALAEGAYALGATKPEVVFGVLVPGALSGLMAAALLAMSRALGETMIVTLAAGATAQLTLDPTQSVQTLTAYLVQVSMGDTPRGTTVYASLFAVGLVLFAMTMGMNALAQAAVRRFRQRY